MGVSRIPRRHVRAWAAAGLAAVSTLAMTTAATVAQAGTTPVTLAAAVPGPPAGFSLT
jgi:hypothetical protein